MKQNHIFIIHSFGEYIETIKNIGKDSGVWVNNTEPPILWFRAQPKIEHSLVPTLYRTKSKANISESASVRYTKLHYAEEMRVQHYKAKNFHLLNSKPESRVEWLEIMQHHRMSTRVMDWSESSFHSLVFSLEMFFDAVKYPDDSTRIDCSPCVWVLNPNELNRRIIEEIKNERELQMHLLEKAGLNKFDQEKVYSMALEFYDCFNIEDLPHIKYIFNLSSIDDELIQNRPRLKQLLLSGEKLNPYFYYLSRIYSDGYLLEDRHLPPLSVVHPYHSERIRSQRGTFSVFPFYKEAEHDICQRKHGFNIEGMEHNKLAQDCLYQVIIDNPQQIAAEAMINGLNDHWLYPEMAVISTEIEKHHIL